MDEARAVEHTSPSVDDELVDFAQAIADQVASFLIALREISRGDIGGGQAISLLLLEVSQLLLAGGRLGVQVDFPRPEVYEPDAGPDPDLDAMRHRLGLLLEGVDAYTDQLRPLRRPAGAGLLAAVGRPDLDRLDRRPRPAPLQVRPRRRGAVVVAVLLRRLLGQRGQRRAARPAVRGHPRPARQRRLGRGRGPGPRQRGARRLTRAGRPSGETDSRRAPPRR